MYNEALKERFIQTLNSASRRELTTVLFNTLEKYENDIGADICTWKAEDLRPVLSEIFGFRSVSKRTRLSVLRTYSKWCVEKGVPGATNAIFDIEDYSLDKLKRQMVANPMHLQRYLNVLFADESLQTVDCIYRCYCWLAYCGLKEEDVLSLTKDNVDMYERIIRFNDKEYMFYNEAVKTFKQCLELKEFRYIHPHYSDKAIYKDRASGNKLLRGIKEIEDIKVFRVEFSRRQGNPGKRKGTPSSDKTLQLRLSYYRLGLSGLFYRQYEAERAGIPVDFMDAAFEFMEGKEYDLSCSRNLIGAKQRQVARDYMKDYISWKEAYNI